MLVTLQSHLSRFSEALRARTQSLSKEHLKSLGPSTQAFLNSTVLKIVLLLGAAILLATHAYDWSREESLKSWLSEHTPSSSLVSKVLETARFNLVTRPEEVTRLIRWMPTQMDTNSGFWADRDLNVIVYFTPKNSSLEPIVMKFQSPPGVLKDWQPLGDGWTGLENVLQKIRERPAQQTPKKGPPVFNGDPREFKY